MGPATAPNWLERLSRDGHKVLTSLNYSIQLARPSGPRQGARFLHEIAAFAAIVRHYERWFSGLLGVAFRRRRWTHTSFVSVRRSISRPSLLDTCPPTGAIRS